MKKNKLFLSLILGVIMVFTLFACGNKSKKVTPIFQGISVKNEDNESLNNLKMKKKENDDFDYDEDYEEKRDEVISSEFDDLEVESLDFYAVKGQSVYVALNFYNPNQFEILSFVLNGVKYQSYQFSEDSTSSNIYIKMTIPNDSGYVEYTVDEIKYIDGTSIKNVIMEGEKTVKGAVSYQVVPYVTIKSNKNHTKITIDASVYDTNGLIAKSNGKVKIFIFNKNKKIKSIDLVVGDNNVVFDNLDASETYNVVVSASYDALDGNDDFVNELYSGFITTNDAYFLDRESVTSSQISFDVLSNALDFSLTRVDLFKDGTLIKSTDDSSVLFGELLSNTEYDININYKIGNTEYTDEYSYKTTEKLAPNVGFSISEITDEMIKGSIPVLDIDNTLRQISLCLYHNDTLIDSISNLEDPYQFEFSVNANMNYVLDIQYSYELNDGNGLIYNSIEKNITTAIQIPTLDIVIKTISDKSMLFDLLETDINEVGSISRISLYEGKNLVNVLSLVDYNIYDLNPGTIYRLVVLYQYDLNDGKGSKQFTVEKEFKTWNEMPTLDLTLESTTDSIGYDLIYTDLSETMEITSIDLVRNDVVVASNINISGIFENLLSNNEYTIKANYSFMINDEERRSLSFAKSICTLEKNKPIVGINITNENGTSLEGEIVVANPECLLSLSEIKLYIGDQLVKTSTNNTAFTFDVNYNTTYIIELSFTYNLNDGLGVISENVSKTVKTAIQAPEIEVEIVNITDTTMSFDITENDPNQVGSIASIKVYKDTELVKILSLTDYNVSSLLPNTLYKLVVVYGYDFSDGSGAKQFTVEKEFKTFKKKPQIAISSSSTKTTINYELDAEDGAEILEVALFDSNNDKVQTKDSLSGEFIGLLSGNAYTIVVNYQYAYNDDNDYISVEVQKAISTIALKEPTVGIKFREITSTSISGDIVKVDQDNILIISSILLYKNSDLIETSSDLDSFTFGTEANNTYVVKVEYSYNLNDGNGPIDKVYEYTITTDKIAPTVSINPYNITSDSIYFTLNIIDINSSGSLRSFRLYKGVEYIQSINQFDEFITNLLPNTNYSFALEYQYDLNDGTGAHTIEYEYSFLTYKVTPSVSMSATSSYSEINVSYDIIDQNGALSLDRLELWHNDEIIESYDSLKYTISDLLSNNEYELRLYYNVDLNNNNTYEITRNIKINTLAKATPTVEIELESTKTSISYTYNLIDVDTIATLASISLYKDDILVSNNPENSMFNGLLSNNEYELRIALLCDYCDGNDPLELIFAKKTTTLAKTTPTVEIELQSTKTSISYSYELTDTDSIATLASISLYRNDALVSSNPENNIFNGLLSNNEYELRITLLCDYNDGNDPVELVFNETINTLELESPTLDLEFTSTQTSISYELSYVDNDNILEISKVCLYYDDELIDTITDLSILSFDDLESNRLYTFKVYYSYDLNDGNDPIESIFEKDYSTLTYNVEVLSYSILNESMPKTDENISIRLNIENESNIHINYIYVNDNKVNIAGGDYENFIIFIIKAGSTSGLQEINIQKIEYSINGVIVYQDMNYQFSVQIASRLNVLNISLLDGSELINSNIVGVQNLVVKIDNPDGYAIKECIISGCYGDRTYNEDELIFIDSCHFSVIYSLSGSGSGRKTFKIVSITYKANGEEIVRNYNDEYNFNASIINPDDRGGIEVISISSPAELLAIQSGKSYEIENDIDMTGYSWNMINYSGYIDGRGHTIKNISLMIENEYTYSQNIGLFSHLSGTMKNIYFENIYVSVQTMGRVYFDTLSCDGSCDISSVLISGSVNIDSPYDLTKTNRGNITIVGTLNINSESSFTDNSISKDVFNSDDYRINTLGWNFIDKDILEYDGFEYIIIDNSYIVIKKYANDNDMIVVPNTINGLPVIGISDLAFADLIYAKIIRFNSKIIYYGGGLLSGCSSLEELATGSIEFNRLFGGREYDNTFFNNYAYIPNSLTSIITLKPIKHIPYQLFNNWTQLTSVEFNRGLEIIEGSAFKECKNLTSVSFVDTISVINESAFQGCSKLNNIVLPSGLEKISNSAFNYCQSLSNIVIASGIKTIGNNAFANCPKLISLNLPNTIETISQSAFSWCTGLESINLPESLKTIGYAAFNYCEKLTCITIPSSIEMISERAFYGCSNLKVISIPKTINKIPELAFESNGGVEIVNYEGSVDDWNNIEIDPNCGLKPNAYYRFNCYESLTMKKNSSIQYIEYGNGDIVIDKGLDTSINRINLDTIVEGHNVIALLNQSFYNFDDIKYLDLGASIEYIGDISFYGCEGIIAITLPKSIKYIGTSAFANCRKLYSLTLPVEITEYSDYAFNNCPLYRLYYEGNLDSWNSITFGNSVFTSNHLVNYYGSYNKSVFLNDNNMFYILYDNNDVIIYDSNSNVSDINIENIIEDHNLIVIYQEAFKDCTYLTDVALPSSLTNIGFGAFSGCSSIEKITIPFVGESRTTNNVLSYIFGNENGDNANCASKYLKEIIILDEVSSLSENAFYNCNNLISVELPSSITSVGQNAFNGCNNLMNIYYDGIIDEWCNISLADKLSNPMYYASNFYILDENGGVEFDDDTYALLEELVLSDSITTIGQYQFYNFKQLTSISLPNSLTSIGINAFKNCNKLTSAEIPTSVISIGIGIFNGCSALTSVTIPFVGDKQHLPNDTYQYPFGYIFQGEDYENSIQIVQNYYDNRLDVITSRAYYVPNSLKHVTINGSGYISSYAFSHYNNLNDVIIGKNVTGIGKYAFYLCNVNVQWEENSLMNNIGEYAFGSYQGTQIVLPQSIASIEQNAFAGSAIIDLSISSTIHNIGANVFNACGYLTNIYYEGTMDDWCNINLSNNVSNPMHYASNFYILDENGNIEFNDETFSLLTKLIIPNSVTRIGNYQFHRFIQLTDIELPNSITEIAYGAFEGCSSLTSISIPFVGGKEQTPTDENQTTFVHIFGGNVPDSIRKVTITGSSYLPNSAFANCQYITNIILKDSLETIGNFAFSGCKNLVNIAISSNITSIGQNAFNICNNLTNIYYEGTMDDWCNISLSNNVSNPMHYASNFYILDENGNIEYNDEIFKLLTELVLTNQTTTIGQYQFYNFKQLSSILLTSSLTSVGINAFNGCINLTNIYYEGTMDDWCNISLSNNVSNPMHYASNFYILDENGNIEYNDEIFKLLTELVLTNQTTIIGQYQFYNFKKVLTVRIPSSVEEIDMNAFQNCNSLFKTYYGGNESEWREIVIGANNDKLTSADRLYNVIRGKYILNDLYEYDLINDFDIYNFALVNKNILDFSFDEFADYNIISIANDAFSNCNLINIVIPDGVVSIGCQNYENSSINTLTIPDSVNYIGDMNITYSDFRSIYYGGSKNKWLQLSVNFIGGNIDYQLPNVYYGTTNGRLVYGPNYEYRYDLIDGLYGYNFIYSSIHNDIESFDFNTIDGCIMKSLANEAFMNFEALSNIVFSNSIEEIGEDAFNACTSLSQINLPDSVKTIKSRAFANCSITFFVLSSEIKEVSSESFIGTSIFKTYYNNTIDKWLENGVGESLVQLCSVNLYFKNENGSVVYNDNRYSVLTEISINDGMEDIGNNIRGLKDLRNIEIPGSITVFNEYAFSGCVSLENVYYNGTIDNWFEINFANTIASNPMLYAYNFYIIDEDGLIEHGNKNYTTLTELVIPETITEIYYQIIGFSTVKYLEIHENVTHIEAGALYGYSSLETLIVPFVGDNGAAPGNYYDDTIATFFGKTYFENSNAFDHVEAMEINPESPEMEEMPIYETYYMPNSLKNISITNASALPCNAIEGISNLDSLLITNTIKMIGDYNYTYFPSVNSIYYKGTLKDWCDVDLFGTNSCLLSWATYCYILDENGDVEYCGDRYSLLTSLDLSNVNTSIKDYQFNSMQFEDIILGNVKTIGRFAFAWNSSLRHIELSDSLLSIDSLAFFYCENLETIIMGNRVSYIDESAFEYCYSLDTIYYRGSIVDWEFLLSDSVVDLNIVYYYSEEEPLESGNYWHYVDEIPTKWN